MTIAVVAHDAGGAELLAHYVRKNGMNDVAFALEGPAHSIFQRVLGPVQTVDLDAALQSSDWLLTGSSWQSELEWRALGAARSLRKRSVTFLDHWVNYEDRFVRGGEVHLPDAIWVADHHAQAVAKSAFPGMPIENVGNPYLESIAARVATQNSTNPSGRAQRVLIVMEPVSEHALMRYGDASFFGYSEFDALALMLARLPQFLDGEPPEHIVVRPHPSEQLEKYEYVTKQVALPLKVRRSGELLDEILDCSVVIGCESMALVVALVAGRRSISCIPVTGRPCPLPQDEIERWH